MKRILKSNRGEGSLGTGVKIIIAVVVGVLILGGLFALYRNVIFPKLNQKVEGMIHTEDTIKRTFICNTSSECIFCFSPSHPNKHG